MLQHCGADILLKTDFLINKRQGNEERDKTEGEREKERDGETRRDGERSGLSCLQSACSSEQIESDGLLISQLSAPKKKYTYIRFLSCTLGRAHTQTHTHTHTITQPLSSSVN